MSKNYEQLVFIERMIRKKLITKTVIKNPTTDTSQLRLCSYRLMCHAEIEFFIEERILDKLRSEKQKWQQNKCISFCISNLLAYQIVELEQVKSNLSKISTNNDFSYRVGKITGIFEKNVRRNHGIKEENIIPLLIPMGIDYLQLDQTLLNNLSSFGADRGSSAHNSIKVHQLIIPNDEISKVSQIIQGLEIVDNLIEQI